MARPPRIDFVDGLHHVTSRGNGRAAIFWTDDDRRRFPAQLAQKISRKSRLHQKWGATIHPSHKPLG